MEAAGPNSRPAFVPWHPYSNLDEEPMTGAVRVVCISDTRTRLPEKVPPGDVLVHVGEFANLGSDLEILEFTGWLKSLPHKHRVIVPGDTSLRDILFQGSYYEQLETVAITKLWNETKKQLDHDISKPFAWQKDADQRKSIIGLLQECIYLEEASCEILGITFHGSPPSPACGGVHHLDLSAVTRETWKGLPGGVDVLLTAATPMGGIKSSQAIHLTRSGVPSLLEEVQARVRPRYHVFGSQDPQLPCQTDQSTVFINAPSQQSLATSTVNTSPFVVFDIIPQANAIPHWQPLLVDIETKMMWDRRRALQLAVLVSSNKRNLLTNWLSVMGADVKSMGSVLRSKECTPMAIGEHAPPPVRGFAAILSKLPPHRRGDPAKQEPDTGSEKVTWDIPSTRDRPCSGTVGDGSELDPHLLYGQRQVHPERKWSQYGNGGQDVRIVQGGYADSEHRADERDRNDGQQWKPLEPHVAAVDKMSKEWTEHGPYRRHHSRRSTEDPPPSDGNKISEDDPLAPALTMDELRRRMTRTRARPLDHPTPQTHVEPTDEDWRLRQQDTVADDGKATQWLRDTYPAGSKRPAFGKGASIKPSIGETNESLIDHGGGYRERSRSQGNLQGADESMTRDKKQQRRPKSAGVSRSQPRRRQAQAQNVVPKPSSKSRPSSAGPTFGPSYMKSTQAKQAKADAQKMQAAHTKQTQADAQREVIERARRRKAMLLDRPKSAPQQTMNPAAEAQHETMTQAAELLSEAGGAKRDVARARIKRAEQFRLMTGQPINKFRRPQSADRARSRFSLFRVGGSLTSPQERP